MINFTSLSAYRKAEKDAFIRRAKYALAKRSFKLAGKLCNDVAKYHFARFMVVDANATKVFCWTLAGAYSWVPFCAPELVRIIDTQDYSIVAERRHSYV